jgi:hypothetical protein
MADDSDTTEPGANDLERAESLLPYDLWTEQALRHVVASAISHVAEHGLPGEHHFYLTFRTDLPGVVIPPRLRAQYPREMTIVLQHQFWGLSYDAATGVVSVGLSFGGVPSTLGIPLTAITAFADPPVRFGLRFRPPEPEVAAALPASPPRPEPEERDPDEAPPDPTPQVVSLDAFRRRTPPKDGA